MAKKRKHFPAEIATLLAQAEDLARQGQLQSEIARTLGVSVMTLHRWHKAQASRTPQTVAPDETDIDPGERISDLKIENARLRKLVTDLRLEKMKLEEAERRNCLSTKRRAPQRRPDRLDNSRCKSLPALAARRLLASQLRSRAKIRALSVQPQV